MTMYETINAAISVKQAAEHYGLKASRNGMACCPFHNDRHPLMNERDTLCRSTGQDRKHRFSCFDSVDTCQIEAIGVLWLYSIFNFLSFCLFPFIIMRCRNQASSLLHPILEHGFLRCGLTSGIDDPLSIRQVIAPFHRKGLRFQSSIAGNHCCGVPWEHLTSFCADIPVFQSFHYRSDHLDTIIFRDIESSAHGYHLELYDIPFYWYLVYMSTVSPLAFPVLPAAQGCLLP